MAQKKKEKSKKIERKKRIADLHEFDTIIKS